MKRLVAASIFILLTGLFVTATSVPVARKDIPVVSMLGASPAGAQNLPVCDNIEGCVQYVTDTAGQSVAGFRGGFCNIVGAAVGFATGEPSLGEGARQACMFLLLG